MDNDDVTVEILATWIVGAALQIQGGFDTLRFLVRLAASDAARLYVTVNKEGEEDEPANDMGVRSIIGRFASAIDEDKRFRDQVKREEGE